MGNKSSLPTSLSRHGTGTSNPVDSDVAVVCFIFDVATQTQMMLPLSVVTCQITSRNMAADGRIYWSNGGVMMVFVCRLVAS